MQLLLLNAALAIHIAGESDERTAGRAANALVVRMRRVGIEGIVNQPAVVVIALCTLDSLEGFR